MKCVRLSKSLDNKKCDIIVAIKETTVIQPVPDSGLETVKIEETLVPLREKSPSSTKPTKTNEIQEELYLGDEENESMQGETFDLFAAVDKLL